MQSARGRKKALLVGVSREGAELRNDEFSDVDHAYVVLTEKFDFKAGYDAQRSSGPLQDLPLGLA